MIDVLKADIEKYAATAAQMAEEIAGHEEDIATFEGDVKAATKIRETEKAEYDKTAADMQESIDALGRAIATLKGQSHDRKQASLVQLKTLKNMNLIPVEAKKTIDNFLSTDEEELNALGLETQAPEANAYEFQSGGIVDMLTKLEDKFIDELNVLNKEEMNSKQAYEMLKMDLNAQIE